MQRFNVNDVVICINNTFTAYGVTPKIKKGSIYKVQGCQYCVKCGKQSVEVGVGYSEPVNHKSPIECAICGTQNTPILHTPVSAHRFLKVDETTISALIEMEEYELCTIIENTLVKI